MPQPIAIVLFAVTGLLTVPAATQAQTQIGPVTVAPAFTEAFAGLSAHPRIRAALEEIEALEPETIAEQIRITEIPAPPFMEDERAADYLQQMHRLGMPNAYIDDEGNVIGRLQGGGEGPLLVLSAHLDTVFPPETDVRVRERNGRLFAPGISDDSRGLAVVLRVMETIISYEFQTVGDIMFVGTVGEEGRGDLRGVKALFADHTDIDGFISIDGANMNGITNGATGSRRYEFQFSGPGGHSFGAFGLPSAIHAMGRAISHIGDIQVPPVPRTTFTVGTVEGGTSVNSIAGDAMLAIDMRSNDPEALANLERIAKAAAERGVAEENARWGQGPRVSVNFELIGDRPAGLTPLDSPIVQVAALSFAEAGARLMRAGRSSTDSNLPMSLGIPAITIGGGGVSGGAHSLNEWFEPFQSAQGPQAALLLSLALVGVQDIIEPMLERRMLEAAD